MTKHTILFLAANPLGTDRLALDEEARAIGEELERSGHRDQFELVTRWAVRPLDLLRELRKLKPTIVHFSGHGSTSELSSGAVGRHDIAGEGAVVGAVVDGARPRGLFFQGPEGGAQVVSTLAIQQTFGAAGASVKLVVLNACYSDVETEALLAHVGCVVGISGSIRDDSARNFAIGFYGGLGERESVAAAYRQGSAAIGLEGLPDGGKPRLRVRDGVDAEQVVLADLTSRDPSARSRGTMLTPRPAYDNAEVQVLSKQLENARARREILRNAGIDTRDVDCEILGLRRQLREGGQLRAGDALGDGRYLLIRIVGRGGFAVVWEAHDRSAQQRVAIKVLQPNLAGDPQSGERFFRGAKAMMKLLHPAVVRVLEPQGQDGGFYYFVMEFVAGGNLREAVLAQRVKRDDVLPLILQVGELLGRAHSSGMVHRDIKPANILLDEDGQAKLTDFDLVSSHDTTGGTRTGALGTVVYAAPECLERPQEATPRADVYGLGMTTIFCLSGRDLSLSTFKNPEPTIAGLNCTAAVQAVLRKAVAWEPDARFCDALGFVEGLRSALNRLEMSQAYNEVVRINHTTGVLEQPASAKSRYSGIASRTPVDQRWQMSAITAMADELPGVLPSVWDDPMTGQPPHERLFSGHAVLQVEDGQPSGAVDRTELLSLSPSGESLSSSLDPAHSRLLNDRVESLHDVVERPRWAVAAGRDKYGPWAAFEVDSVQQRMRWIRRGTFPMGSPKTELGRDAGEGPQHNVTLTRGYWLGETPVTQALWSAVMGDNPSHFRGDRPDDLQRPVERVSWDACQAFCERLNAQVAGLVARLPTEAQWERACRAGTAGATWVRELWGEEKTAELDTIAWHKRNSGGTTHPVGRKAPNPYGLHDMLGNVWEWCADEKREYTDARVIDPVGDKGGSLRVYRGGSWYVSARLVRAAYRFAFWRDARNDVIGFRLAEG